jgi:hypothetical protein
VEARAVGPGQGWAWISGGLRLFLASPVQWVLLLVILFFAMRIVNLVPLLALLALLLMPVFLAGLMEGCRALEQGRPLEIGHLASGFYRNAPQLVTLGGISLVGHVLILMIVISIGGDAFASLMKTLAEDPGTPPQMTEQMQQATASLTKAAMVGTALSLPLLMALWFAPLLVFFHDLAPLPALKSSFFACLRNVLPLSVYGLVLLAAMMVLVPFGASLGQLDLGLWLMAPVLVPSIYASFRDLYADAQAGDAGNPDTAA